MKALIETLVRARREAGLTQSDVAKALGVSQATVSEFETGLKDPRISTLQRYARAVGATLSLDLSIEDQS